MQNLPTYTHKTKIEPQYDRDKINKNMTSSS